MMKPDFSQMSCKDLRAYVLVHRKDDDAIEALIKRRNPNSPKHRFPQAIFISAMPLPKLEESVHVAQHLKQMVAIWN
ncbi:MAG: hypothetical protein HC852_11995 [Acaryochloridaceae cyanobacterium RU_4_10]|nr:hypothetical protein [Acaryochloridaceae cyanobacterium RU_4_10]